MKIELYYQFKDRDYGVVEYIHIVSPTVNDIVEYEFEKRYGTKFNICNYYLVADDAKEWVKFTEERWYTNNIDLYEYSHDSNFVEWLTRKYENDAFNSASRDFYSGSREHDFLLEECFN